MAFSTALMPCSLEVNSGRVYLVCIGFVCFQSVRFLSSKAYPMLSSGRNPALLNPTGKTALIECGICGLCCVYIRCG